LRDTSYAGEESLAPERFRIHRHDKKNPKKPAISAPLNADKTKRTLLVDPLQARLRSAMAATATMLNAMALLCLRYLLTSDFMLQL
jgi:hypothetical protein